MVPRHRKLERPAVIGWWNNADETERADTCVNDVVVRRGRDGDADYSDGDRRNHPNRREHEETFRGGPHDYGRGSL
jgi:hypothetical protein